MHKSLVSRQLAVTASSTFGMHRVLARPSCRNEGGTNGCCDLQCRHSQAASNVLLVLGVSLSLLSNPFSQGHQLGNQPSSGHQW